MLEEISNIHSEVAADVNDELKQAFTDDIERLLNTSESWLIRGAEGSEIDIHLVASFSAT